MDEYDPNEGYRIDEDIRDKVHRLADEYLELDDNLERVLNSSFNVTIYRLPDGKTFGVSASCWKAGRQTRLHYASPSVMGALGHCVDRVIKHLDSQGDSVQNATG